MATLWKIFDSVTNVAADSMLFIFFVTPAVLEVVSCCDSTGSIEVGNWKTFEIL